MTDNKSIMAEPESVIKDDMVIMAEPEFVIKDDMVVIMKDPESCLDIFPIEVWESILGCLGHDNLLTCRLVCKDWKYLVDDVFERHIWKPYFASNRIADVLSTFLVKCKGTRFGTAEDVDVFFKEHEKSEEPIQNPFLNHTVIMNCRSIDQYTELCNLFPMIVGKYGQHIRHIVYFVHNEVIVSVEHIPYIFSLKNLHTVTIYCSDWDRRGIKAIFDEWNMDPFIGPPLEHFRNLNILGDRGYTVLKTLFSAYSGQIKRLNCWGHNLMEEASRDFVKDIVETITDLEEFKVCDVSSALLASLCNRASWMLRRLSVRISYSDDTINLGNLMEALRKYSSSLESFHLQVDERQLHNNVFLYDVCFPNLRDLRVPFYFVHGIPFYLYDLAKKLPRLEHLQLVESDKVSNEFPSKLTREQKMDKVIDKLWPRLPPSIQVVSVRYRKNGHLRASGGLLVYKYKKTKVSRNDGGASTSKAGQK